MGFICNAGSETICSLDTPTGTSCTRGCLGYLSRSSKPACEGNAFEEVYVFRSPPSWLTGAGSGPYEGATVLGGVLLKLSSTLTKGLPDMPSSTTGGRIGIVTGLGDDFSGGNTDAIGGRRRGLSVDAERLTGVFDARDPALPLDDVDNAGRTKPSVRGEEVAIVSGAMRGGTTMAAGRSLPMMAMTLSTTYC